LRSNTIRPTELQVIVGCAAPTDLERIPRLAGRRISGKDLDLSLEGGAMVRTSEVSWLSSASRDESWKSRTACQSTAIVSYQIRI
jgi:hypothetical protein